MTWVAISDWGQGLNRDTLAEELPLGVSSNASNVRFRNGFAETFRGMANAYTTPVITPYHNCHYTVGSTRFMVYTGLQKTYVDDGTTQTDITNANNTGAIDDRWCGFVFNGVYIQNNGVDVPQFWGGSTGSNLANLTGWPAGYLCSSMRAFGNYIVALDITRSGVREYDTILWSSSTEPGAIPSSWNIADATKDAGDVAQAETNGNFIDSMPLGDMNVLYKDDALHYQQLIGGNQIFKFGRLPGDTGLLARGCVQSFPGGHVYLTPGFDVVVHGGQGLTSILEGRMQRWLASNINATYAARAFLAKSPASNEILICFPSGSATACDKALVWNWKDNTFGTRDLNGVTYGSTGQVTITDTTSTWAASTDTWASIGRTWGYSDYAPNSPRLVLARSTPALSIYDAGTTDFGTDFATSLERTGLHLDAPGTVKLFKGIRPKFEAADGTVIKCQLGAAMTPYSSPTYSTAVDFTVGTDIEVHSFASGRFGAVKFYTTTGSPWRMRSCEIDVLPMGGY